MDTRKAEDTRLWEGVNKQLMFEGEEWLQQKNIGKAAEDNVTGRWEVS